MAKPLPLKTTRAHRTGPVDYSLMAQERPPIAGPGSEVVGIPLARYCWCGYCGYTGRVLGPVQASCPERNGFHRWLERCVELHHLPDMWADERERLLAQVA